MPGVYLLKDKGDIVYVGKSINIISRIKDHKREKLKRFDSYSIIKCETSELDNIEAQMIWHYQPVHNIDYISNKYVIKTPLQKRLDGETHRMKMQESRRKFEVWMNTSS